MKVLNHFVLVLNVLFDLVDVLGSLPKVFLSGPVLRLFALFGSRENVFDGVGDDEIFVRFEAMYRSVNCSRDSVLLVPAVVGEIADWVKAISTWGKGFVAHGSCMFLQKSIRGGFSIALDMPESLGVTVFSMGLQSYAELASQISALSGEMGTTGLDVVWWQKVEPVGLMLGGNFDL